MRPAITLRPYRTADAASVAALINADAQQSVGFSRAAIDALGNLRLARYLPPSCERVVAVSEHGELVAACYLVQRDHPTISEMGGAVHPAWWGRGVGGQLIGWAQQRALAQAPPQQQDLRLVIQTNLFEGEAAAQQLFRAHGFQPVREWARSAVELTSRPALPDLPTSLQIRAMDLDNDWELVGPVMDAAFSNHWGAIVAAPAEPEGDDAPADAPAEEGEDAPVDDSFSNAPGFCFVLLDGERAVGGVLCNAKLVERSDSGRVGSIFVDPGYQRRGVGRALMLSAFRAFWDHGIRRVILDTDAQSFSDSPLFYAALGMRRYRREWLYEHELRAGRGIRRLAR